MLLSASDASLICLRAVEVISSVPKGKALETSQITNSLSRSPVNRAIDRFPVSSRLIDPYDHGASHTL